MISRRGLITGLAGLVAAPAIVRVESLMKVRALDPPLYLAWNLADPARTETAAYLVTGWDAYGRQRVERVEFGRWSSVAFREIDSIRIAWVSV